MTLQLAETLQAGLKSMRWMASHSQLLCRSASRDRPSGLRQLPTWTHLPCTIDHSLKLTQVVRDDQDCALLFQPTCQGHVKLLGVVKQGYKEWLSSECVSAKPSNQEQCGVAGEAMM